MSTYNNEEVSYFTIKLSERKAEILNELAKNEGKSLEEFISLILEDVIS